MSSPSAPAAPSRCGVCAAPIERPLYVSDGDESLTSLCTTVKGRTVVEACDRCGHLQTPPMLDLDEYYATTYRIVVESEEEDQLYKVVDGRKIFRAAHQADTLLAHADLPQGARVLDYGAAKGATLRLVLERRPDLVAHVYDVTETYVPYWHQFLPPAQTASFELPDAWRATFDLVCSFFMLEHVEAPATVVADVRSLLRPGGQVHLVIPNVDVNIADFVVVDHVNHFTASSLRRLFHDAGFVDVAVDDQAHDGAWVVDARRPGTGDGTEAGAGAGDGVAPGGGGEPAAVDATLARAAELASFWHGVDARIAANEAEAGDGVVAIYGAGFYGTYVFSRLVRPQAVVAFVDQNPFLQGRTQLGRPIVAPPDLAADVTDVHVGLNPTRARSIIDGVEAWQDRALRFHYL